MQAHDVLHMPYIHHRHDLDFLILSAVMWWLIQLCELILASGLARLVTEALHGTCRAPVSRESVTLGCPPAIHCSRHGQVRRFQNCCTIDWCMSEGLYLAPRPETTLLMSSCHGITYGMDKTICCSTEEFKSRPTMLGNSYLTPGPIASKQASAD